MGQQSDQEITRLASRKEAATVQVVALKIRLMDRREEHLTKTTRLTSTITRNSECQRMRYLLFCLSLTTQLCSSLKESNGRRPLIYYRKRMVSWMWWIFSCVAEINSIYSSSFITWHFATKSYKCLKNVLNASSSHWNTSQLTNSILKKGVSQTEWENCNLLANWNCSTVPSYLRFTDTRMPSINRKRVSGLLIIWSMILGSYANFILKERILSSLIRMFLRLNLKWLTRISPGMSTLLSKDKVRRRCHTIRIDPKEGKESHRVTEAAGTGHFVSS